MLPRNHQSLIRSKLSVIFLPLLLFGLAGQVTCRRPTRIIHASRHNSLGRLREDQHESGKPKVVQTVQKIGFLGCLVTERCSLTFAPVSLPDGVQGVKLVKSCTFERSNDTGTDTCVSNETSARLTSTSHGVSASETTTISSSAPGSTSPNSVSLSQSTAASTKATSSACPTSGSVTNSCTSLAAISTTNPRQTTSSLPSLSPTATSGLPALSSSTKLPSSFSQMSSQSSLSSAPVPDSTFTVTLTTATPGMTPSVSNVASSLSQQSSTLPKVLGIFAGVSVLLLIVAGVFGYLKQKKMTRQDTPMQWPITRG